MLLVMITGSSKRLNRPPSHEKWEVLLPTLADGRGARQGLDRPPGGRVLDQRGQPALRRLLPLRAHHPVRGRPAVPRRLRLEELPRRRAEAVPRELRLLVALE